MAVCSFGDAARGLERVPDLDLPDPRTVPVPVEILIERPRSGAPWEPCCASTAAAAGIHLGEISGSTTRSAPRSSSTPVNFRQILSRADTICTVSARQLQPGDPDAPCKCVKKTVPSFRADSSIRRSCSLRRLPAKVRSGRGQAAIWNAYMKWPPRSIGHPSTNPPSSGGAAQALKGVSLGPPA